MKSVLYKAAAAITAITISAAAQAQCNVPTGIAHTTPRCDSALLSWTPVAGAASYIYAVTQSPTPPGAGQVITTASLAVGNLQPSGVYYFHVKSNCTMTVSSWVTDSFHTPACAPGTCLTPATLTFGTITPNSINMSWSAITGATGYEYIVDQTFADPVVSGTLVTTASATANGLTPNTNYYFHVRTQCGPNSFSPWKQARLVSTPACATPASIGQIIRRCDSANISWPAVAGVFEYEYTVKLTAATPTTSTMVTTNSVEVGNLLPSTLYYMFVRSHCAGTNSGWRADTFYTPSCPTGSCPMPATITYNGVGAHTANISWGAVGGAAGYEYLINQNTAVPTGSGTPVTGTNAAITGLTPSTTYYFHVRTKCSGATYSPWKTGTALVTPINVGVGNVGADEQWLTYYPSPASHTITVDLNRTPGKQAQLTIYSIDGRKLRTVVPSLKTDIDIHALQSGIYFIQYTDESNKQLIRFVKD